MNCQICGKPLNNPNDPTSEDCGGDCLKCMADAYDPDCMLKMRALGYEGYEEPQ